MICVQNWDYMMWRFSTSININNVTESVYLISIYIVSKTSQIESENLLKSDYRMYVNDVKFQSKLNCLFIMSLRKKDF